MYTIGGYLCHHGVLGQRWGVKNGPPYPLAASSHNASERKAGYKKSIGGGSNEELYNRKRKKSYNNKRYNTNYTKPKEDKSQKTNEQNNESKKTKNISEIFDDISKKAFNSGVEKAVYAAAGVALAAAITSPASSAIVNKLAEKGKEQLAAKISNVANMTSRKLNKAAVKSAQAAGVALVVAAISKGASVATSKKMESDKKKLSAEEYNKRYNNDTMNKISKGYDKGSDIYEKVQKFTDIKEMGSALIKKNKKRRIKS